MVYIKKKQTARGVRYYREDRQQDRSLPIAKGEAEKMLAAGEAVLVEYFCTTND